MAAQSKPGIAVQTGIKVGADCPLAIKSRLFFIFRRMGQAGDTQKGNGSHVKGLKCSESGQAETTEQR